MCKLHEHGGFLTGAVTYIILLPEIGAIFGCCIRVVLS